jgi:hypothetical protein
MCRHDRPCPTAAATDREAAAAIMRGDVQGWAQLCNGLLLFEVMSISQSQGLV